jgi:uncharacterized protein (TIGR00369 family)
MPVADCHRQQHGYVHAGVMTTLADHRAGGAARAAVAAGNDVLTVEFKINFLAPARGRRLTAAGRTLGPGARSSWPNRTCSTRAIPRGSWRNASRRWS